ncbi:hypothetical protein AAG906_023879 [Vitis piasezkii]
MRFWLCLVFFSVLMFPAAEARIRRYRWEVKYEYKSPDCFQKMVITINGQSPGPTILAEEGDTVIVELTNSLLTENVAIHWHGIRQIGTPWFDGTEGVTQCPILPGDTFTYEYKVDRYYFQLSDDIILWCMQPGTYLYHAHYGMQREAGLYGSIRVSVARGKTEPFSYDHDRSIILTDWYHNTTYEQALGLSSNPFDWVGEPQSLLIQGKGRYNCSLVSSPYVCNAASPQCSPYVLTVVPGKTYRLRVSSLTSLSALSFQIEGHNMTVVEADGHFVEPFVIKNLFIYSGETYSVLVKADQDPSRNYRVTTRCGRGTTHHSSGLAIFNYYPNHPKKSLQQPHHGPLWNDVEPRLNQSRAIKAHHDYIVPPPHTSDRVIVFLNTQNKINGYVRWSVNNVSFNLPHTPYLIALKENITGAFDPTPPPNGYDFVNYDIYNVANNTNATSSNSIYRLQFNTTVDIILQNANTMNKNNSETHPWHLHGHNFWVLGYGEGKFDNFSDPIKYNLIDPIMKNTTLLILMDGRLKVSIDNLYWAFHCHIESHFYLGMGVVLKKEGVERVGKLPSSIMGCGKAKGLRW